MGMERYDGPLIPDGNCRWRIPKSYKPGMRVDGLIYADETLIELIRSDPAPEQVANVAFLPGIQLRQPGHARHPLGLWFLHWRRLRDRSGGRGRDLARRRRLRHQLRRAADADEPQFRTKCSRSCSRWSMICSAQIPAGVGGEGRYHFSPQNSAS